MHVMRYTLLYIWWILLGGVMPLYATGGDSVRFSLLTCAPGEQIYELFGHTAIRYQNFSKQVDVVYNYGLFDFDSPHFIWRFVRGETDYQLGVMPYGYFELAYSQRGSAVVEQQLDLNDYEAVRLAELLYKNSLPQNRVYRYNYFYDNCTTRARDRIEEALGGAVFYPPGNEGTTYRGWVHQHTKGYPWADFGISLCLGSEADKELGHRQQMFLPANLQWMFSHATVRGGGEEPVRKLVKHEVELIPSDPAMREGGSAFPLTPMQTALLLLALVALCSWQEWRRRQVWWGIDLLLFTLQGVAGCIITFLFFFSTHPTVGSNWLVIMLNPIPLLYLPVMICRVRKLKKDPYDVANVAVLTLFIAFLPLIPQKISLVIVPLALVLLIRSVLHLAVARCRCRIA